MMKQLFPVKVECYSGSKASEYPVRFYLNELTFDINEIVDRWYQYDHNSEFPPSNYFKVRTADEKIYILKQETESDNWYLWIKGESVNL